MNLMMAEESERERYRAVQTLVIMDVNSRVARKESVSTSLFFSRHDPKPATFQLHLQFKARDLSLSVSVDQDIQFRSTQFKLFDEDGNMLRERSISSPPMHVDGKSVGFSKFYEFEPNDMQEDMDWRVVCVVDYEPPASVSGTSIQRSSATTDLHGPLSRLQSDLLDLLESGTDSNVTFVVKEDRIMAHRGILSKRCDYFQRMFASGMQETVDKEVEVKDAEPEVFRGLLHYLYSGAPPRNLAEISLKLLVMADKYDVEGLKEMAESHVSANLNSDNAVETLLVADCLNNESLKSRARSVFRGTFDAAMRSSESEEMLKSRPDLLLELLSHAYKE